MLGRFEVVDRDFQDFVVDSVEALNEFETQIVRCHLFDESRIMAHDVGGTLAAQHDAEIGILPLKRARGCQNGAYRRRIETDRIELFPSSTTYEPFLQ